MKTAGRRVLAVSAAPIPGRPDAAQTDVAGIAAIAAVDGPAETAGRSIPPARAPGASSRCGPREVRSLVGRLLRLVVILTIWGLVVAGAIVIWAAYDLPRPETAMDAERRPALVLQDRAGQTFATYGDLVGEPLRLADMPPELPAALVAVEDHRFYQHSGIDFIGLARAIWVNVTQRTSGAGWLDDHPAGGENVVSDQRAHACGARSANCC